MSSSIKDFSLNNYTFEGIAKLLHSKDRYKLLPSDAVDEIVELAKSKDIPKGKNKLDVLLAYFEHAITCKVIKKFDLTNKQKQLLFASIQFLDLFLDDAGKRYRDVEKLHDVLTRIATRFHLEIEEQLSFAYKQFAKITNKEDVLCNHLVLSTTMALYFAKDSDIDKKLKDKIIKLSNKIHDDVAKKEEDTEMYSNAANICADFYAHIEKLNNKKG